MEDKDLKEKRLNEEKELYDKKKYKQNKGKKFMRNLFSGFFVFILLLIAQVGIFVFFQFKFDDILLTFGVNTENDLAVRALIYLGLKGIEFIISFIIFFKILNKIEDPEFKIPWIVGMLLMPLLFSLLFLIFGNHGLRKKDKIIVKATRKAYRYYFELESPKYDEALAELGHAYGTFKYIQSTTRLGVFKNNRVTYYKTGEEFFPEMMKCLRLAKEFIFIEFFIIDEGDLWKETLGILKQKAAEGVKVRIIYDDMGCSGTIDPKLPKKLKEFGIDAFKFHPFRPILSGVYNNRDHRKIVIIDHQMAFTGGMNLGDEYANKYERFGYWKDTMVKIEGSAINNLLVTFLQNYNLCIQNVSDYNRYIMYDYPKYEEEGYVMPFGDGPGGIDDALIGEQNYINMLNYATKTCYISTPYLVPTYPLLDALRNAANRGVDVRLIVPGIPDKKMVYKVAQSHFKFLIEAGVKIYIYKPGFNHMKSMLCDDELAFVGTINFDFRSLVHHFECGTILYKNPCIKDIKEDFLEMLSVSELVPENFKLSLFNRALCSIIKLIQTLL